MLNLKLIKKQAEKELELSQDLKELNHVFDKYLGKKGELSFVLSSLSGLSKEKRAKIGKEINVLKSFLRKEIEKKKIALSKPLISKEKWFDISQPGKKLYLGHLHPLTLAQRNIEDIFQSMGFSIIEGPEVENEWYNFDALNIPKNHPARDLWDTFYLKNGLLLRTHTSPVQMRYMEKNQPPLRIIVPGRVFRHEATDASHESNFYHLEGLMVGKDVSVANFKAIIQEFLKRFFEKKMEIRMRPSYFPFVEPGFEIDIKWCSDNPEIFKPITISFIESDGSFEVCIFFSFINEPLDIEAWYNSSDTRLNTTASVTDFKLVSGE